MHCGVEVTESSTNKQQHCDFPALSRHTAPSRLPLAPAPLPVEHTDEGVAQYLQMPSVDGWMGGF